MRERDEKAGRQAGSSSSFLRIIFTYKYVLFWDKFSKYIFSLCWKKQVKQKFQKLSQLDFVKAAKCNDALGKPFFSVSQAS